MIFSNPSSILLFGYFILGVPLPNFHPFVEVKGSLDDQLVSEQVYAHLDQFSITDPLQIHVFYVDFSQHPYLKNGYRGYTHCLDPLQGRHFRIFIHKGLKPRIQALVLAHEMVHVKQYYYQELTIKSEKEVCWKGECFPNFTHILYQNRPWEQEAIHAATKLLKTFRKKQEVEPKQLITQQEKQNK